MARLGMLAPEFRHETLRANLAAIAATGATDVQFDLVCAVGETFPASVDPAPVRRAFGDLGLTMAALSGTYNMIDPDPFRRAEGLSGLKRVIAAAPTLGTSVVTLCTGSRDPDNMWRRHPDNDAPEAWADLVADMRVAVATAEAEGVTLGIEPEIANTIDSAVKARRLMDEIGSPNLKVIMDGANVFHHGELAKMRDMLDEAFALGGKDIILAHAKDLDHDGEAGHVAAGKGLLDYPYYLRLLQESGYDGAIILHALRPTEAIERMAFVRQAAPAGYIAP